MNRSNHAADAARAAILEVVTSDWTPARELGGRIQHSKSYAALIDDGVIEEMKDGGRCFVRLCLPASAP